MALTRQDLSVWEIGYRWEDLDPASMRVKVPLAVQDHFRNLMHAIYHDELPCVTLKLEKWAPGCGSEPASFIRHHLDAVFDCMSGKRFDRKLLRWAIIDRSDLRTWCGRRDMPLPEFWFRSGWKEFDWEQRHSEQEQQDSFRFLHQQRERLLEAGESTEDVDAELAELRAAAGDAIGDTPQPARTSTQCRIACQVVATQLWRSDPAITIPDMVRRPELQDLCGAKPYAQETVRGWIKHLAPPDVRKAGRPRSGKSDD